MGNPMILYFLNQKPQSWKDQYIKSFISMSGPYGGAAKTLRLMASGIIFIEFHDDKNVTLIIQIQSK